MADIDKKTTDLTELTTPAVGDVIHIVDVSDTTDDVAGSSKKIKVEKIIPAGGTTGQVLMKKSDTDFDTEFDDLVAVSVTTKGDIQTHDGVTPTALPVGTDGQILMADDTEDNGIKWSDPPTSVSVTTKGDIQTHDGTDPSRLGVGVDGQVLSSDSTETNGLKWIDSPSGGSSNSIINNEVPSGTIDGSNATFTLANTPVSGSVSLYLNGVLQKITDDYTISTTTITFVTPPLTGDKVLANYLQSIAVSDNADTLDGYHANATPTAEQIPVLDSNGKLPFAALYSDGWILAEETWEYVSVDDPTGVFRVNADVTAKYSAGMRIKFTNGGNIIYGIITVVGAYTGGYTSITFLHQIDATDSLALYLMANSAITLNYYSTQKAPFGFPLETTKWSCNIILDTSQRSQASPTQNVWYNLGSLTGNIPIGLWRLIYSASCYADRTVAGGLDMVITLSTANNSESDGTLTSNMYVIPITGLQNTIIKEKIINLTSKTAYYLNARTTTGSGGVLSINFMGNQSTTTVKAICAYL